MPRLIAAVLRHAHYNNLLDTPSAHQPFPITANGEAEALESTQVLRKFIKENNLSLCSQVDSSRLLRAWQTAKIMSDTLADCFDEAAEITCYDVLAERCVGSVANLDTKTIEDIIERDPRHDPLPEDWKSNSHYCLPFLGAESLMDAGQRVADHLNKQMTELKATAKQDTLKIFVGHGAAFRHAAHLLGTLEFERIAELSMFHAMPVFLELAESGEWKHIGGEWKVRDKYSQYTD